MANKVQYGFRNVFYSVITESGNTITYGTPVAFNTNGAGGISVSLAPKGDKTEFYADDVLWFGETVNQGYEGDLILSQLPTQFKKDVLGWVEDSNGALVENADATPKNFALGFEVQGNENPTRTWYYYCSVARPSDEANSKEATVTPNQKTLTITVSPRPTDKNVKVSLTKATASESIYNSFFSAVYERVTSI